MAFAAASAARADEILGVRDDGALVTYDSADPATFHSVRAVTGNAQGELIVGVDFRPSDGGLYAVGNTSRLYRIDPATGVAVLIGSAPFSPLLEGTDFGVAFDVTGGALRVTSDTGQNLVLDSGTGATVSNDPRLVYAAGDAQAGQTAGITACGWRFTSQTGAVLYGIDLARGLLVTVETPSAGTVRTVGALGVAGLVGGGHSALDASPSTGTVFAVLGAQNGTASGTYAVNLATGAATQIGALMPALLRGAAVVASSPPAPAGTRLIGLVAPADLVTFTTDAPGQIVRTVHLRGLPPGAALLSIATRPADGVLYGLTRQAFYDIDVIGGTAARVGGEFPAALAPSQAACDFDPSTGALRVVAGADTNLRIDAATGAISGADAAFTFAAGDPRDGAAASVDAIAFTGRDAPALPSKCYVLETGAALLARLGSPADAPGEARSGLLFSIGPLSIEAVAQLPPGQAFTTTGERTGYAALQLAAAGSSLFHVDLTTGAATRVGAIAAPGVVRALTVEPRTNPPRVTVEKMSAVFKFGKASRDSLTLRGAAPYPAGGVEGKTVTIDVGGLTRSFVLDAKGRGRSDDDTVKLGGDAARGLGLKIVFAKEDLALAFADEQMDGSVFARRAPRQVGVVLTLDGGTYRAVVDLAYSATPGKTGSAKTN